MSKPKIALMTLVAFGVVFAGVTAALKFNEWQRESASIFKPAPRREAWLQNASNETLGSNSNDFRVAAKKVLPSVVSVDTQVDAEDWFGRRVTQDASQGSGVVISADGYIVTNNHVLRVQTWSGSQLVDKVRVTFNDGRSVSAKIIGSDPRSDLAVLKVEGQKVEPITVGDSSKLEVGQWVIAVGNPLGYENTLSVGVVSNVGRQLPGSSEAVFIDGIQTDAAINPGNSGGALCTSSGELIGINSSIASTTRANIGIGFAIPTNRMKQVVDDIIKFGYAKYGQMGVQMLRRQHILGFAEAREELKRRTNASAEPPTEGAVVLSVQPSSPAASAGLKDLDVITEINGKKVTDIDDFQKVVSPLRPGAQVSCKVWSAGKTKSVTLTLTDAGRASL